jgi:hypothetical protein
MKNKTPISFEEHKLFGRKFHEFDEFLGQLLCANSHAGSLSSKAVRLCERLDNVLMALRSEMEEELFRNHAGSATVHIYYPGKGDSNGITERS